MSVTYNLTVKQGSTFRLEGQLKTSSGLPYDLSEFEIRSQYRPDFQSTDSGSFTASIDDAPEGLWSLELAAADTEDIEAGCYRYDIEIHSGSFVDRIIEGKMVVTPEVTK
jgi:hypothetical protein